MSTLPKVGAILEYNGRRAVVIGIAGTYNRGILPARPASRTKHYEGPTSNGTITGVHVQHLDNGNVSTVYRSELHLCTIVSDAS